MRKLKLDVDALRVSSFHVAPAVETRAGTVHGHHNKPVPQPLPYSEDLRCTGETREPITTFDIPCVTFTCL